MPKKKNRDLLGELLTPKEIDSLTLQQLDRLEKWWERQGHDYIYDAPTRREFLRQASKYRKAKAKRIREYVPHLYRGDTHG